MTRILTALMLALMIPIGLAMPAAAQLQVRVDEGNFQPTPLAIPDFEVRGTNAEMAEDIADVVRADLELSLIHI